MRKVRKIFKLMGIAIVILVLLLTIVVVSFLNLSPQFGGVPSAGQKQAYAQSGRYEDGKFANAIPTPMDLGFADMAGVVYDFVFGRSPGRVPGKPLPVEAIDSLDIVNKAPAVVRLTWFGHSACLLEADGKKILIDPMLGQYAGPHSLAAPQRYNKELPIEIDKLPALDAVVISHDHYDHLDYGSIVKLTHKVNHFYVPLGVSAHLVSWGVPADRITELDWWQEVTAGDVTFICTPARHFSGRGMFDRFSTLWCSWVIKTASSRVYFSGDSGYGPHFKEIGDAYGPFDLTMIECGQYNELWTSIHMMPEETVQAAIDTKSKLLMPIHWGAFTLAMHSWTDPIRRVTARAHELEVTITTPMIGEPVVLHQQQVPRSVWWE